MSKPLIDLKKFFTTTAFGRTLSGRNKTGQTIGAILNPILIATGLKPAAEALGHLTGADEAAAIAEAKGTTTEALNLNLTAQQERYIRLGIFLALVIASALGVDLAAIIDAIDWQTIKGIFASIFG